MQTIGCSWSREKRGKGCVYACSKEDFFFTKIVISVIVCTEWGWVSNQIGVKRMHFGNSIFRELLHFLLCEESLDGLSDSPADEPRACRGSLRMSPTTTMKTMMTTMVTIATGRTVWRKKTWSLVSPRR